MLDLAAQVRPLSGIYRTRKRPAEAGRALGSGITSAWVIACAALIVSFPEGRLSACQATPGGIFRTLNCGEAK